MSTLTQLNTYSNSQIPFEDDRSLIITPASTSVPNTNVGITEDFPIDLTNFGVTFSELRSLDNATADHITLTFDFSAASNPRITWPAKTAYVEGNTKYNNITFSTPSTGLFVADNIQLNTDYVAVLANTVIRAVDQVGSFNYTITVSWPGNSYTQTFTASVVQRAETTLNGLVYDIENADGELLFFDRTPAGKIIDGAVDSLYSLEINCTIGELATVPGGTKSTSITITGDKDTVNAALDTVFYYPPRVIVADTDSMSYTLTVTNGPTGSYVSETGTFTLNVPVFISTNNLDSRSFTYTSMGEQLMFSQTPFPTVVDETGQGITMDLTITTTGNMYIKESETTGLFAQSITLTGTESQLNTAIQQLWIDPYVSETATTTNFTYSLAYASIQEDNGSFSIDTPDSVEVINFGVVRSFTENTTQTDLFDINGSGSTIPSIVDNVGQDLKLVLTTTNVTPAPAQVMQPSRLIAPGASYPYATSVSYDATPGININNWIQNNEIGFIPESGEFADHTVNWEIQRLSDSTVLISGSFTVAGTARTTALASEGTYTYNWNGVDPYFELDITEEMRLYCKADILLSGGGGAGGQRASQNPSPSAGGDGGSGGVAYASDAYLFSVTDAQAPGGYGTENSPQFRISVGRGGSTTNTTGEVGGDTNVYYYANANWNNRLIAGIGGGGGGGGGFASTAELTGGSGAYGGGGGGVVSGVTLTLGQGGSHLLQPNSNYLGNFFGENLIKERYTNNIYIRTEGGGTGPGYGFSDQGRVSLTGPASAVRGPDATTETYGTTDYAGPGRYDATWNGYTPGYNSNITGTTVTYGDNGGGYSQGDADGNRSAVSPTNGGNGTAVIKVKAA